MSNKQQWPTVLRRLYEAICNKNKQLESSLSAEQMEKYKNDDSMLLLFYGADMCTLIHRDHPDWPDELVDALADQRVLESLFAPPDLITQAAAAKVYGELTGNKPTVQAINQAIQKRQLVGYKNPAAKHKRQSATLVSEAAVRELWQR